MSGIFKRLLGWNSGDERRAQGQTEKKSSLSPCSSDRLGSFQTSEASRQGDSVDISAEGPAGDLWIPCFRAGSNFPPPKTLDLHQSSPLRPGAPALPKRPRDAGPAGTHPTATRRQRRAGRTMSASQAAANRPSGEPDPGGAGPSCSEFHSERSAELGSCGSSKKRQPTASARKPA